MVLAFALALGLGYLLVGGESYGFPRYHVPLIPVLALLAASQWESLRRLPALAILQLLPQDILKQVVKAVPVSLSIQADDEQF